MKKRECKAFISFSIAPSFSFFPHTFILNFVSMARWDPTVPKVRTQVQVDCYLIYCCCVV